MRSGRKMRGKRNRRNFKRGTRVHRKNGMTAMRGGYRL